MANVDASLEARLEGLLKLESSEAFDLQSWLNESLAVAEILSNESANGRQLPEEIWHYLADIDNRVEDPEFGRVQRKAIRKLILGTSK